MNGSPVALVVESLGWTLLDFVWQGALVAAVLYCLLACARNASASVRYLMACAALLVVSVAVVLTFVWHFDVAERQATRPELVANDSEFRDPLGTDGMGRDAASVPADLRADTPRAAMPTVVVSRVVDAEVAVGDLHARALGSWPDRLRGWLPTIVGLWGAGVGLLSLRLFVGWRTIRRLRGAGREVEDPAWIERFAQLRQRLGVSRTVRLLASASATVPFVVGWLRPVVLVPAGLLTGLTPSEIEAIFAHELAHIRRHDFLVNLVQNVVETLLFYHPAIWWISAQIRRERENCCDDVAAAICGGALDYAKALVALEQLRPAAGLMVAASGGSLLERIRRLAGASASDSSRAAWPLPALVLFLGAAIAIALVAAGESSQGQQKEKPVVPETAAEPADEPVPRGIEISVVDAATKQPIPRFRVLAGVKGDVGLSEEVKERYPGLKFPKWRPVTLREGENGALLWPLPRDDEMVLRVEADGYQPQASWLPPKAPPATLEFALIADAGVAGKILQPDGRPAAWASLAIVIGGKLVHVTNGQIEGENDPLPKSESGRWRQPTLAKTDAEGNFRLPTETDPGAAVLMVHESGVIDMSFADFRNQTEITLKRWGRVAGKVLWKDRVGADQRVCALTVPRYEYGYPGSTIVFATTHTDAQGNFVLDKVLPGRGGVSAGIDLPGPPRRSGTTPLLFDRQTVEVDSDGEPAVLIGGQGRTVAGRLTGRDSWEGVTLKCLPKVPDSAAFAGDGVISTPRDRDKQEMWRLYGLWEGSSVGPLYFRSELKPNADGTFEISHVLPGHYQLSISAAGATHYFGGAEFSVEHERSGDAPPPLDLDEIKVEPEDRPAGQPDEKPEPATEKEPETKADEIQEKVSADKASAEAADGGNASADGIKILVMDAVTKQPIPSFQLSVRAPATETDKLLGYRAGFRWRPVQLSKSGENDFAFRILDDWDGEMTLRVEADGYRSAPTTWRKLRRPKVVTFSMHVDAGISGRILQPDGQPAAGATIAIATPDKRAILKNDHISADSDVLGGMKYIMRGGAPGPLQRSERPTMAKADADGRFSIATEDDRDAWVLVVHESGAREMTNADFRERPNITLDRWGRVEGQVVWKDHVGADERVGLSISYDYGSVFSGGSDEVRSDAEGRFVFEKVLPGDVHVAPLFGSPRLPRGWTSSTVVGPESLVKVTAGETVGVLIGGKGRTVRGRLIGRNNWEGVSYSFAPAQQSHKFPVTLSRPFYRQARGANISWGALDHWRTSSVGPLYFRDLRPNADGSFEILDVLPGTYRLIVSAADVAGIAAQIEYSLPAERPGEAAPVTFFGEIPVPARADKRISPGVAELFREDVGGRPR